MVKPKKKCVVQVESTFSVTGFLTFAVVSATAVANVIANINNNNDNNNNNNNQDNVNNNNQISNSADAENMGNARNFFQKWIFNPETIFCHFVNSEAHLGDLEMTMTSILGFIMADFTSMTYENVVETLNNPVAHCPA